MTIKRKKKLTKEERAALNLVMTGIIYYALLQKPLYKKILRMPINKKKSKPSIF